MVVIRLARHGAKKAPFYHVNVAEKSAPRDGAYIERIGYFNPIANGQAVRLQIDLERADHWLKEGAQISDRVRRLIKEARNQLLVVESPDSEEEPDVAATVESDDNQADSDEVSDVVENDGTDVAQAATDATTDETEAEAAEALEAQPDDETDDDSEVSVDSEAATNSDSKSQ